MSEWTITCSICGNPMKESEFSHKCLPSRLIPTKSCPSAEKNMSEWKDIKDVERIKRLTKIDQKGCWIWTGAKKGKSHLKQYGNLIVGSRSDGSRKSISAHRFSFQTFNGNIPEDKWVLHHCDNPSCVNPDHLYLGSRQDNVNDREKRNRNKIHLIFRSGENHPSAKLNCETVNNIRLLLKKGKSCTDIAKVHGVHRKTISDIKLGKTWKNQGDYQCDVFR